MTRLLAIDPGPSGGLAVLSGDGRLLRVQRMPKRKGSIDWAAVHNLLAAQHDAGARTVVVEEQRVWEGTGRSGNAAVQTYGVLLYHLQEVGFAPVVQVAAQTWQSAWNPGRRDIRNSLLSRWQAEKPDASKEDLRHRASKEASRRIAEATWPGAAEHFGKDWTEGTWEAALIGEAHRRREAAESKGTA